MKIILLKNVSNIGKSKIVEKAYILSSTTDGNNCSYYLVSLIILIRGTSSYRWKIIKQTNSWLLNNQRSLWQCVYDHNGKYKLP